MRSNSTSAGATAMRALVATALVLLLVGACATDDGAGPSAPPGDACTDGACTPGGDICGAGGAGGSASSAGGAVGAGGAGGATAGAGESDAEGGCSCRVAGAPQDEEAPTRGLAGLLLVGLAVARRRRTHLEPPWRRGTRDPSRKTCRT